MFFLPKFVSNKMCVGTYKSSHKVEGFASLHSIQGVKCCTPFFIYLNSIHPFNRKVFFCICKKDNHLKSQAQQNLMLCVPSASSSREGPSPSTWWLVATRGVSEKTAKSENFKTLFLIFFFPGHF